MHILLTDRLACPRCGPEFGLILLAERIEDRRVVEGRLGCANCRETYPVRGGALDLRTAALPEPDVASASEAADPAEAAVRLAALLGLTQPGGTALLVGPGAELAAAVAALVPELEVVALTASPTGGAEAAGVSRVAGGPGLPFRDHSLRGVALTGGADAALLAEALRVAAAGSRVVVEPAGAETAATLAAGGAKVLLEQEDTVVAAAPGTPVPLRLNALR